MRKKIFVVCPAYAKSGGPELLHQLVFALNKLGYFAQIAYYSFEDCLCTSISYPEYVDTSIGIKDIEDSNNSIIVLPETRIDLSSLYFEAKICIWWMSVDNYFSIYSFIKQFRHKDIKSVIRYIRQKRWKWALTKISKQPYYHLAQSQYAIDFLYRNGFKNVYYLSDYINVSYSVGEYTPLLRKNIVLYNPKKGYKFTKKLMSYDKSIEWLPLINMTGEEVKQQLLSCKVYVDFGNHPGKDRLPREAVLCGCCLITGRSGAAKNDVDIPIPKEYKFDNTVDNISKIISKIYSCFDYFEKNQCQFLEYKSILNNEKDEFLRNIEEIFSNIISNSH